MSCTSLTETDVLDELDLSQDVIDLASESGHSEK
jgi:hypothetical protein